MSFSKIQFISKPKFIQIDLVIRPWKRNLRTDRVTFEFMILSFDWKCFTLNT